MNERNVSIYVVLPNDNWKTDPKHDIKRLKDLDENDNLQLVTLDISNFTGDEGLTHSKLIVVDG